MPGLSGNGMPSPKALLSPSNLPDGWHHLSFHSPGTHPWFFAMHLLTQLKNRVSALKLKRHLAVNEDMACLIKYKPMQGMGEREDKCVLDRQVHAPYGLKNM